MPDCTFKAMTITTPTDNLSQSASGMPMPAARPAVSIGAMPVIGSSPTAGIMAPAVVYLLADHLDAVLARGEDLLGASWRPDRTARCSASIAEHQQLQRTAVGEIRMLELVLISRALKARERSRELSSRDQRFAPLARVFAAATASLEDAAREAGDPTGEHFDTGNGIIGYMRGRGMVAADVAALDDCGSIVVTPRFLVARRIELDTLLDMAASFLDALEIHYDLYPDAVADTATENGTICTADDDDRGPEPAALAGIDSPQPLITTGTEPEPASPAATAEAAPQAPSAASLMERISSAPQT